MKKILLLLFLLVSFGSFEQLFSKAKILLINDTATYCDFTIKIDFENSVILFSKDVYHILDVTVLASDEIEFQCLDKNGSKCNITLAENLTLPSSCSQSFYIAYSEKKYYVYFAEPISKK